jgi:ABC-type transporter lipoprotein component MlaA
MKGSSMMQRLFRLLAALVVRRGRRRLRHHGEKSSKDPWEGMNRGTHAFNTALDDVILKPTAKAYVAVIPGFAREGVNNFFDNLEDLNTGLQNILQGKPKEGLGDLGRLLVNSTVGIFGLWDVATPLGLEKHYEDFGQTLGKWGVGRGRTWCCHCWAPPRSATPPRASSTRAGGSPRRSTPSRSGGASGGWRRCARART